MSLYLSRRLEANEKWGHNAGQIGMILLMLVILVYTPVVPNTNYYMYLVVTQSRSSALQDVKVRWPIGP